ncbi:hypothetical protein [Curtobacterium sp. AB7]
MTPGVWVVIGVVVAFFVITTILNATGGGDFEQIGRIGLASYLEEVTRIA